MQSLLNLTKNIKNYLQYKYLLIIDGDNNIHKLLEIISKVKEISDIHIIIFINGNSAKNKNIQKFEDFKFCTLVCGDLYGGDSSDIAISLFCGQLSLFSNIPTIGILTEDHFGPNLVQLMQSLLINIVYINYYDILTIDYVNNFEKIFTIKPDIRTLWRFKWLQSAKRFAELYKIDVIEFGKWYRGVDNKYITKIVNDFLDDKPIQKEMEKIDMTDEELFNFYKENWKGTQGEFCRQYGSISAKNFSRWLLNKNPNSNASRNAVLKFAHEFCIKK